MEYRHFGQNLHLRLCWACKFCVVYLLFSEPECGFWWKGITTNFQLEIVQYSLCVCSELYIRTSKMLSSFMFKTDCFQCMNYKNNPFFKNLLLWGKMPMTAQQCDGLASFKRRVSSSYQLTKFIYETEWKVSCMYFYIFTI